VTIIEQGSGPAPQAAPDLIKETTTQTFVKDVIEESKRQPVLIDFWAPWCGPCRNFAPVFERASAAHPDITFGKVDTEAEGALAASARITAIPTLMAFRAGVLVHRVTGALPAPALADLIASLRDPEPAAGQPGEAARYEPAGR
jgi:putative thioredoxin